MVSWRRTAVVVASVVCATVAQGQGRGGDEREAVRRAVLDYVEGFYEGDTAKLVRALRPELYKYGFSRPRDSTTYRGMQMTHAQALAFARRVREGKQSTPANAPKVVELLDVQDQTAAAKLTAWWGLDYLLLAKYDGRWMISSVMWQSPPPRPAAAR